MPSPYLPHAIYSVALITLSIHLVSQRKSASEERAHVAAQTSILESIRDQLGSDKPLSNDELVKLKRLARPLERSSGEVDPEKTIGWGEIFGGRKKEERAPEMNKWDKKDMEKLQKDMSK
ncbi:hypothetical protein C0991_005762 [Blastosporella zonata]|nr:hypothetical protein C0991_005762 [Blastosporella zonata]